MFFAHFSLFMSHGMEAVQMTLFFLPNLNVLVDFSKVMQALKLCSSKILQFLTEFAG